MSESPEVRRPEGEGSYLVGLTADCAQPDGSTVLGDIGRDLVTATPRLLHVTRFALAGLTLPWPSATVCWRTTGQRRRTGRGPREPTRST